MSIKNILLILFLIGFLPFSQAKVVLKAHQDASENKTFLGSIGHVIYNQKSGNLYVAVGPDCKNNDYEMMGDYSVASYQVEQDQFFPFLKKEAVFNLNNDQKCENPLYQTPIRLMGLVAKNDIIGMQSAVELPFFVTQKEPDTIYLFESIKGPKVEFTSLLKSPPLKDAFGRKAGEIVAIETGGGYIFAAIAPEKGKFGDPGSAITVLIRGFYQEKKEEKKEKDKVFVAFNQISINGFDMSSPHLFGNYERIKEGFRNVLLHWDDRLQRLYIGVQFVTDSGRYATAFFVGRLANVQEKKGNKKKSKKNDAAVAFVVKALFNLEDAPEIHEHFKNSYLDQLSVLHTTGGLPYLIIQSHDNEKGAMVRVLPLTGYAVRDDSQRGMIAKKGETPVDKTKKWPKNIISLAARSFVTVAQNLKDITPFNDPAALSGSGILKQSVKNLFSQGDSVFAVTEEGLFQTQAILDEWGAIKDWSMWKKVLYYDKSDNIQNVVLCGQNGTFILFQGDDQNHIDTITRTKWDSGDKNRFGPYVAQINKLSEKSKYGITAQWHGELNFFKKERATYSIFGGKNQILLTQWNKETPLNEIEVQELTVFAGTVSSIESVLVGEEDHIFVGGSNGLFVLQEENSEVYGFEQIGKFSHIRKLYYDRSSGFLYVLTEKEFFAVNIQNNNSIHLLISTKDLELKEFGTFTDFIVSGPFALLGTTNGLYQVDEGYSIKQAINHPIHWKPVFIPEGYSSITKLIPITKTDSYVDMTQNRGGHLYVVTGYAGKGQSRLNRFEIMPCNNGIVESGTIKPFQDWFIKDNLSYFVDFYSYVKDYVTDGSLHFFMNDTIGWSGDVHLSLLSSKIDLRSGLRMMGLRKGTAWRYKKEKSGIAGLAHCAHWGNWIFAGTHGLIVND